MDHGIAFTGPLEEGREGRRQEDKANKNRRWLSKGMKRITREEEREGKSQKDKLIRSKFGYQKDD